tara:strand:- start:582 stop:806 length:225 start_codon:yes stop_codon:yes gene_type:complete
MGYFLYATLSLMPVAFLIAEMKKPPEGGFFAPSSSQLKTLQGVSREKIIAQHIPGVKSLCHKALAASLPLHLNL